MEGQQLGPYQLMERIGGGGMAAVYRAYQPSMDRMVAIKVLSSRLQGDDRFLRRFRREARTIARLAHKHILPVHDFGQVEGVPYLVMRYLDNGTLEDALTQGEVRLADTVRVVEQVAEALDYAHRQNVIHRDVKPANIMFDSEGDAFLTDFGIAKVLADPGAATLTEEGFTVGTAAYMAPEQGLGRAVDARTDVYSLGVVVYQLVVGELPYLADTPLATALAHIHEPLPLPREIDPSIPPAIEAVIVRALAKDPAERYQTTRALADALEAAYEASADEIAETGATVKVLLENAQSTRILPPAAPPRPAGSTSGGRSLPVTLMAGVGGVLLLAVVVAAVFFLRDDGSSAPVEQPPRTEHPPEVAATFDDSGIPVDAFTYDGFDDPAYAFTVDPTLWTQNATSQSCSVGQSDGLMLFENIGGDEACGITVRHDMVTARELKSIGARLDAATLPAGLTDYRSGVRVVSGGRFEVFCGVLPGENNPAVGLRVWEGDELSYESPLAVVPLDDLDLLLTVDPLAQTFTCFAGDDAIGTFEAADGALEGMGFGYEVVTAFVGADYAQFAYDTVALFALAHGRAALAQPYDDFATAAYECGFDPFLWETDPALPCLFKQAGGLLEIVHEESAQYTTCQLTLRQPPTVTLDRPFVLAAADVTLQQGEVGWSLDLFTMINDSDSVSMSCGFNSDQTATRTYLGVYDSRLDGEPRVIYTEPESFLTPGVPTRFELVYDPVTQGVTCAVDGQPLAYYSFGGNDAMLTEWEFIRLMTTWRDAGADGVITIDKVKTLD